jgi:DNA-directed RNA polymerase subunit RPC12/RpoP
MQALSDRVAYLRGLAEGLISGVDADSKELKLILSMIDVMGDIASEIADLREKHAELDEYVESIDDDLAELEEVILDEDNEDMDEDGDDASDGLIEYECPHCGHTVYFDTDTFDLEEENKCPHCGKPVFENRD